MRKGITPLDPENPILPDEESIVDLGIKPIVSIIDGDTITDYGENTEVKFSDEEEEKCVCEVSDHKKNLALFIDEQTLNKLAEQICEEVDIDIQSRVHWDQLYSDGMKSIGAVENKRTAMPFEGASECQYPMISTAIINFQARALSEILPANGPVKSKIVGKENEAVRAQAQRVENHLNYQITEIDEEFFDETDKMLFYLPLGGSAFKKVYWDDCTTCPVSKFVRADELIIPYTAKSLLKAERYTHIIPISQNKMKQYMASGFYRDIELIVPSAEDEATQSQTKDSIDEADRKTPNYADDDHEHIVHESHRYCNFEEFPHLDPKTNKPSGIALPYIVSVDKRSRKVLSVYRNWEEEDVQYKKRVWFIHYKYLPGVGLYGFGLPHIIGGLQRAATGAMQLLLDSSTMASFQGGFKAKDSRVPAKELMLSPGEWKDVNLSAEELSKAFFTPPFKEPSPALMNMLQFLVESGQRATSTTEAMVGDANNNGPVGTTLALIEQGSKVYSGIHKRVHNAARQEYKLRALLNRENLEHDREYPYEIDGESRYIKGSDYDDRVDVIPSSDPNVFSSTQRIAKEQALMQLADGAPDLYNRYKVHKRMLQALEVSEINEVLPDPYRSEIFDPVTENQKMLVNQPVKAHPEQNHQAHIAVHMAFLQHPSFGGDPNIANIITGPMVMHLAEHKAYEYRDMMNAAGAFAMPIDVTNDEDNIQNLTIEEERAMSELAAQAVQQFSMSMGMSVDPNLGQPAEPPPDPNMIKAQADIENANRKLELENDIQNKKFIIEQEKIQKLDELNQTKYQNDFLLQKERIAQEIELKREAQKIEAELKLKIELSRMMMEQQIGANRVEEDISGGENEISEYEPNRMSELAIAFREVAEAIKAQQLFFAEQSNKPKTVILSQDKGKFVGSLVPTNQGNA
jgi:chaperonin GroES